MSGERIVVGNPGCRRHEMGVGESLKQVSQRGLDSRIANEAGSGDMEHHGLGLRRIQGKG